MQNHLPEWDDDGLGSQIESILLVAGGPVSVQTLAAALRVPRARVSHLLEQLRVRVRGGIRFQIHDGSAQLVTAPENLEVVHRYLGTSKPPPLSRSSLETLVIVAYQQPVTRPEIESIRGVNADRAVQTLMARGLIEERGRRATLGKPTEYGTTFSFLEYFGLSSLDDLPELSAPVPEDACASELGMRTPGSR